LSTTAILLNMEIVYQWGRRLLRREYYWVCLFIVITLALHFSVINLPAETLLDEQYYVGDARNVLQGEGTLRTEHPPLGQLIVLAGMRIFGDTPLGWRFFSVIFGTISILLIYLICRQLGLSRLASNLAICLFAFENMSFVQAGVAMLDVFSVTFTLAAFWLYLRRKYPLTGLLICLATLIKLSGALTLPAIALHWLVFRRDNPYRMIASLCAAPLLFFLLIPGLDYFLIGQLANPLERVWDMLVTTQSITYAFADHPYATRPWEWLISPQGMPYWYTPKYSATVSYTIWALIIPATLYALYAAIRGNRKIGFLACWITATYLLWIPISLITERATYPYYFYPTVGAFTILIGAGLARLIEYFCSVASNWRRRTALSIAVIYLVDHLIILFYLTPMSSWWLAPLP
jgi:dolichyl-phosphate-mannose-protein mannosyltransferase